MGTDRGRIIQGDCLKELAKLAPESVELAFADPPFNIGYEGDKNNSLLYLSLVAENTDAKESSCRRSPLPPQLKPGPSAPAPFVRIPRR